MIRTKKFYDCTLTSAVHTTFPFTRMYSGKAFHQSLLNVDTVRYATHHKAKEIAENLRARGWLVRIEHYETNYGPIYVVYERRSHMQKRKMAKDYGSQHVKAAGIVNRPPQRGRRARRKM